MVVWQIGAIFQVLEQQVQLISIKMDLQVPNPTKVSDGSARNYNEMEYLIIK
jgi:hypothetical protein